MESGRPSPTTSRTDSSLARSISDASPQSLSSILNNPHLGKSGVYSISSDSSSWVGWWSSSTAISLPEFSPLSSSSSKPSDLTRSDFLPYISSILEPYQRFEDIRRHTSKEEDPLLPRGTNAAPADPDAAVGQGDALVACLREVPALYFKEDFTLEDGPTFRAACPFSNVSETLVLQEKLSQYLDVVELHLVKEISLRSNSFFEAQGQLQDLNVKIVQGCKYIRELKETIRLLDKDLVDSARHIQELNSSRNNLLVLQQKLRLILSVNQALSTLKLLVAAADCAGALDVIDDLQHLLDGGELKGLHCFRHLPDQVVASVDSINSILSAEFMRASLHDVGDVDVIILSKAKARPSIGMNGAEDEVKLEEEETSNFRDRFLHIVIGLLRTAKLPSVLRIYRDMLTADMKNAIKTTVAELLPVLVAKPFESDFAPGERTADGDGGGSSLASKLRSLSSENFVHLLSTIFKIVRMFSFVQLIAVDETFSVCKIDGKVHLMQAAEVKKAIEWIMSNLEGEYADGKTSDPNSISNVSKNFRGGGIAGFLGILISRIVVLMVATTLVEITIHLKRCQQCHPKQTPTLEIRGENKGERISLAGLPELVVSPVTTTPEKCDPKRPPPPLDEITSDIKLTKCCFVDRADVLRENAEAVFAACDAAHGRWAKLLGVRALLHPRLRLQEFLSIYNITQEFISATEKIGGRLGYSIRGTLQSQAKSFVDFQHESRMTKIKAVLDQETWVEVDVPEEFQTIVYSLFGTQPSSNGGPDVSPVSTFIDDDGIGKTVTSTQQEILGTDSIDGTGDIARQAKYPSAAGSLERSKADDVHSSHANNSSIKERGRSAAQSIVYRGVGYHMVNCGLILVKMLSEYIDMNNFLPALSSEVVLRVVEILKHFNTRTCQLVLGAHAMQVSGLKSITSKHLALASQVISFVHAIIPEIRHILFMKVPETRKALLLLEMDRVAQDYKVHQDEIHSKLVQIMRERLLVHLRGLQQIFQSWNNAGDNDAQPSQFARSLTKEVGFLQRVLSRTLHEADVQAIFRQVVSIFHSQISEAFTSALKNSEVSTAESRKRCSLIPLLPVFLFFIFFLLDILGRKLLMYCKISFSRLCKDTRHILSCIRSLPTGDSNESVTPNWGRLDEFLAENFGTETAQ
ncbi:hypothetical protein CDL15_Pgr026234 [Punica granatum]|uniref:Vacuolar protein sorting-associated protein 54 C-terminal domain-containing protein n=1 Tax=Punica granatum TaxID=22663 RepID=A0A218VSE9_PUNGR|nr:hypothetical protein CDL15_Pgr026234 [Punica granatum]